MLKDRIDLYKDFALNLLYYIDKYYLDKSCIFNDSDISNHFSWCYNKVCDEFKEESIDFTQNKELKKYFYTYYYSEIYTTDKFNGKEELPLANHERFWKKMFEIGKEPTKGSVNMLLEIYIIFDKSINVKK